LDEAWTVAIEALSWVELQRINEDSALNKTINQLDVKNNDIINEAKRLVFEVLKRKNSLDFLINKALAPEKLQ
jgi:hypothetical protein